MLVASARSADPGSTGAANVFVNDPCLDPPPTAPFPLNFFRTVQSETEIAVLNDVRRHDDEDDEDDDDMTMRAMTMMTTMAETVRGIRPGA